MRRRVSHCPTNWWAFLFTLPTVFVQLLLDYVFGVWCHNSSLVIINIYGWISENNFQQWSCDRILGKRYSGSFPLKGKRHQSLT